MGNILQTLQGALQPPVDPLAQYRPSLAGPGGFSSGTEAVMGFPSVPYSSPPLVAPSPADIVQNGQGPPALAQNEDLGTVQGWAPKKPTILGAIADAFLMSKGGKPMYTMMRNQENMQRAMRGFTSNPEEAIRRVGMIPGMQEKAWDMYNQQYDNETARASQDRMNRSLDMRNEDYMYNYVANMMGTATEETWPTMRELAIKRAVARGMDPIQIEALIPPTFDPTSVEYIRYGQIKNKDQIAIKQKDRALDQRDTSIQNTQNYRSERLDQINRSLDIRERGKALKAGGTDTADRIIQTKYGPGQIFNKGLNLMVSAGTNADGSPRMAIYQKVGDNQWKLAGYKNGKIPGSE